MLFNSRRNDLFGQVFFDADGNGSGSSDGSQKAAESDGSQKAGEKKYDQESIQHGINIANAKAKDKISALEKDLNELKKFRDEKALEAAAAEEKDLEKKQEYQKIIEKNKKSFDEKESTYNNKIGSLENDISRLVIDSEIAKIAPELKVVPEAIGDFIKITAAGMGYSKEEVDGKIKYKVFPSNGGSQMISEKTGKEMSVREYLEKVIEQKPYYVESSAKGGGGSTGGRNSSGKQIQNSRDAIKVGMKTLLGR